MSRLLTGLLVLGLVLPTEKLGLAAGGLIGHLVHPAADPFAASAGGPAALHLALLNGTATELPAKLVTWTVDVR